MPGRQDWQAEFRRQEREALKARGPEQPPVGGGDEPPHDPGMEVLIGRVDTIEKGLTRIDSRLDGIDGRLRAVEVGVAGVSSKLDLIVAQMPKWWQGPLSAGALVALILGLLALAKVFHLAG